MADNVQSYFFHVYLSRTVDYSVPMYIRTNMYVYPPHYLYTPSPTINYPRLGDVRAPDWATGLDERGETITSEFRGTGFAGSAVRGGSRTRRGTVVSREWWFLFFIRIYYLRG